MPAVGLSCFFSSAPEVVLRFVHTNATNNEEIDLNNHHYMFVPIIDPYI